MKIQSYLECCATNIPILFVYLLTILNFFINMKFVCFARFRTKKKTKKVQDKSTPQDCDADKLDDESNNIPCCIFDVNYRLLLI